MDTSANVRRHGRNISHPQRQSAARGPLEEAGEDPLAETPTSPSAASVSEVTQPTHSVDIQTNAATETVPTQELLRQLSFLSDPGLYSPLRANDVPKAFLEADNQPSVDTSLSNLLQGGHFRFAADRAAQELLAGNSDSAEHLLQLFYIRLASLVLISRSDLAAQEAAPILDFLARNPPGAQDVVPLIPWDLRLLLVRLQAIGASDGGRRGVMALYTLASEVRNNIRLAQGRKDHSALSTWSTRLEDLGLRVCNALVEMGELETAIRHLDTLQGVDPDELAYRKALLHVRVGDVIGAQTCAVSIADQTRKKAVQAVLGTADGDFSAESWQNLVKEYPSHELFAQNAAVALLYTGHIKSARDVLEELATQLPMFPTLIFNLSTIYELCTERSAESKASLAQRAAAKTPVPDSGGWERSNYEFKL